MCSEGHKEEEEREKIRTKMGMERERDEKEKGKAVQKQQQPETRSCMYLLFKYLNSIRIDSGHYSFAVFRHRGLEKRESKRDPPFC